MSALTPECDKAGCRRPAVHRFEAELDERDLELLGARLSSYRIHSCVEHEPECRAIAARIPSELEAQVDALNGTAERFAETYSQDADLRRFL